METLTTFRSLAEIPVTPIWQGLDARLIHGQNASFSVIEIAPGAVASEHRHPHEQIGMCLRGELTFTVDGETRTMRAGDTWCIAPGRVHAAVGGPDGAVVVEIWAPGREDFAALEPGGTRAPQFP